MQKNKDITPVSRDSLLAQCDPRKIRSLDKSSRPRLHLDRLPEIPEDKLNNDLTCTDADTGISQHSVSRAAIDVPIHNQKTASNCTSSGSTSSSGRLTCPSIGSVVYDSFLDKQPN